MQFVIGFCRYALPLLTFIILFKCFQTLLIGHPINKTYGYIIDRRTGDKIPLNTWETSIGRSKSCDISLTYGDVSRFHAVICRRVDGWYLFDTLSKLGTFVNGEKIDSSTTIKHGDEIQFSGNSFVFAITDDPVIQVGKKKRRRYSKSNVNEEKSNPVKTQANVKNIHDNVLTDTKIPDTEPVINPDDFNFDNSGDDMFINFHPTSKNEDYKDFYGGDIFSQSPKDSMAQDIFGPAYGKENSYGNRTAQKQYHGVEKERVEETNQNRQAALYSPSGSETFLLCSNHITLGRSRASDIRINSQDISRNHALLTKSGNDWYISDAHSTFGTYVNGNKITEMTKLNDGDIILLSDTELRFIKDYR